MSDLLPLKTKNKLDHLCQLLREMKRVMVAYSGGVDSTVLLKVGTETLGDECLGAIGISPSLGSDEYREALKFSSEIGARVYEIRTYEMDNSAYQRNDERRCYYCKSELFTRLKEFASKNAIPYIIDGNNSDDLSDYRPGMQAGRELQIRSPFIEAGLSKNEIRQIARFYALPVWQKPAQPCLSSRIAYGQIIDPVLLGKVDEAESVLRKMSFRVVRVRYFGGHVSVEVGPDEVTRLMEAENRDFIVRAFNKIGFTNINFDESGYQSGKLNRDLQAEQEN